MDPPAVYRRSSTGPFQVDVRPWSERPLLDPGRRETVPVAVYSTDAFDPTAEPVRYRFGSPTAVAAGRGVRPVTDGVTVDVNEDGQDDLVLFFPTDGTGFAGDEEVGMVAWDGPGDNPTATNGPAVETDGAGGGDGVGHGPVECRLVGIDQITLAKRYRWQRATDGPASRRPPVGRASGDTPR